MKIENLKILIVDDDETLLEIIKESFEIEGFQTLFTATSGNDGLAILKNQEIDFVLTDIRMRNGSGLDLLKTAREKNKDTPVIIMYSGQIDKDGRMTKEDLNQLGANGFFKKPIDLDDLFEEIKKIFNIEI